MIHVFADLYISREVEEAGLPKILSFKSALRKPVGDFIHYLYCQWWLLMVAALNNATLKSLEQQKRLSLQSITHWKQMKQLYFFVFFFTIAPIDFKY